jgi:hypothetical protein
MNPLLWRRLMRLPHSLDPRFAEETEGLRVELIAVAASDWKRVMHFQGQAWNGWGALAWARTRQGVYANPTVYWSSSPQYTAFTPESHPAMFLGQTELGQTSLADPSGSRLPPVPVCGLPGVTGAGLVALQELERAIGRANPVRYINRQMAMSAWGPASERLRLRAPTVEDVRAALRVVPALAPRVNAERREELGTALWDLLVLPPSPSRHPRHRLLAGHAGAAVGVWHQAFHQMPLAERAAHLTAWMNQGLLPPAVVWPALTRVLVAAHREGGLPPVNRRGQAALQRFWSDHLAATSPALVECLKEEAASAYLQRVNAWLAWSGHPIPSPAGVSTPAQRLSQRLATTQALLQTLEGKARETLAKGIVSLLTEAPLSLTARARRVQAELAAAPPGDRLAGMAATLDSQWWGFQAWEKAWQWLGQCAATQAPVPWRAPVSQVREAFWAQAFSDRALEGYADQLVATDRDPRESLVWAGLADGHAKQMADLRARACAQRPNDVPARLAVFDQREAIRQVAMASPKGPRRGPARG